MHNLRTLEVHEVDEKIVIDLPKVRCKGVEVTLSPDTTAEDLLERDSVKVLPTTVIVRFKDDTVLAVPRDTPSYEHGFRFSCTSYMYEVNGVLHVHVPTPDPHVHTWQVVDMGNKQIYTYAENTRSEAIALHRGLFWWSINSKRLVGTFVDLANPGIIYYHPRWAVLTDKHTTRREQGRGDAQKFIIESNYPLGINLIDMDTREVTNVRPRHGSHEHSYIPGFENGKLRVYSVSEDAEAEMKAAVWKELGIPERDW